MAKHGLHTVKSQRRMIKCQISVGKSKLTAHGIYILLRFMKKNILLQSELTAKKLFLMMNALLRTVNLFRATGIEDIDVAKLEVERLVLEHYLDEIEYYNDLYDKFKEAD